MIKEQDDLVNNLAFNENEIEQTNKIKKNKGILII
jgi:hypothetical protein